MDDPRLREDSATGTLADLDSDGKAELIVSRFAPPIIDDIDDFPAYLIFKRVP